MAVVIRNVVNCREAWHEYVCCRAVAQLQRHAAATIQSENGDLGKIVTQRTLNQVMSLNPQSSIRCWTSAQDVTHYWIRPTFGYSHNLSDCRKGSADKARDVTVLLRQYSDVGSEYPDFIGSMLREWEDRISEKDLIELIAASNRNWTRAHQG